MPCHDGRDDSYVMDLQKLHKVEAMLCALISRIRECDGLLLQNLMRDINWTEAGISYEEFMEWLAEHDMKDALRRAAEEKERQRKDEINVALSKLTNKEKKLLNLKSYENK